MKVVHVSSHFRSYGNIRSPYVRYVDDYWRKAASNTRFGKQLEKASKLGHALEGALTIAEIAKGGVEEFQNRGYTMANLPNSFGELGDLAAFAYDNPDALLNSLEEGFSSATAVTINTALNSATLGLFDISISGEDVQNAAHSYVDTVNDLFSW